MSKQLEYPELAKICESNAQAYIYALAEAAGGYTMREKDFVLTLFPYDTYSFNGVISPQFNSFNVSERLEYVLRVVGEHKKSIRFRLGPSTLPHNLAQTLELLGLKKSYYLNYMGCELSQMKMDYPIPDGLTIQSIDSQDIFLRFHHPLLGEIKSSKKKRILNSFQNLGEQNPRKYWTFTVDKDGHLIGFAALYFHHGNVGITDFVILKEFHRLGIGTALLQFICSFAQKHDSFAVVLGASTIGAKFYPNFGFMNLGRIPTYLYSKT